MLSQALKWKLGSLNQSESSLWLWDGGEFGLKLWKLRGRWCGGTWAWDKVINDSLGFSGTYTALLRTSSSSQISPSSSLSVLPQWETKLEKHRVIVACCVLSHQHTSHQRRSFINLLSWSIRIRLASETGCPLMSSYLLNKNKKSFSNSKHGRRLYEIWTIPPQIAATVILLQINFFPTFTATFHL